MVEYNQLIRIAKVFTLSSRFPDDRPLSEDRAQFVVHDRTIADPQGSMLGAKNA
jgi:hypothetical protein